jgi:hypothetical protein
MSHNLIAPALGLFKAARLGDRLLPPKGAIDAGVDPGEAEGFALRPDSQYVYPTGIAPRGAEGALDLGAYEARPVR